MHLDIICPSGNPLNLLGKVPLVEPAIHPILAGLVGAANRAGFRYDARAVRPVQKESGKAYFKRRVVTRVIRKHPIKDVYLGCWGVADYSGINVPLVAVCNVPPVAQCNVPPQKWLQ